MAKSKKNSPEKAIVVEHLSKNFEVIERSKGLSGSIRSLISPTNLRLDGVAVKS